VIKLIYRVQEEASSVAVIFTRLGILLIFTWTVPLFSYFGLPAMKDWIHCPGAVEHLLDIGGFLYTKE